MCGFQKYPPQMLQMFMMAVRVNSQVIQVYKHKFIFQSYKIQVHGSLKSGPSIHQSKWHFAYMKVPQGVVKVVFPWSSGCIGTQLYLEKPSRNHMTLAPETLCNRCSILGSGWLSFLEHLFIFLKSTHNLISPLLFLTTTKFAIHLE